MSALAGGRRDRSTPRGNEACLTSYFGWTDPTWVRPSDRSGYTNNSLQTVPWAWPKLIRVTVTLSDPRLAIVTGACAT